MCNGARPQLSFPATNHPKVNQVKDQRFYLLLKWIKCIIVTFVIMLGLQACVPLVWLNHFSMSLKLHGNSWCGPDWPPALRVLPQSPEHRDYIVPGIQTSYCSLSVRGSGNLPSYARGGWTLSSDVWNLCCSLELLRSGSIWRLLHQQT